MGVIGKIGLRLVFAVLANFRKPPPVQLAFLGELRIAGFRFHQQVGDCRAQRRGIVRIGAGAQEYPAAFAATLCQTCVAQYPDMTRNARLALPQHLGHLAHGKLHRTQQAHDPQARGIGKGPEDGLGPHDEMDIKIFLYL